MLKNKIKAFSVLAFVLAISLSLFGLSLDKPCAFVFAEGETSLSEESNTENPTEAKAVAKIGDTEYKTLAEAVAAATAGETVTMIADYNVEKIEDTVESQNIVSVDMTLDLNGHKITFFAEMSEYKKNHVAIYVKNGATFTVTDSSAGGTGGIISALDKSSKLGDNIGPYTFDVVNGALVINGGYYLGGGTVAQVETGKVTVNGGVFEINPYGKPYNYDFMFNCIDSAYIDGTATIEVNGGTFKNWDPFNSAGDRKEGVNARFTTKGVGVTRNSDGDYVATSGKVAQVVDVNGDSVAAYATLAEAVAAAKKGDTVVLISNIELDEQVATGKAITIDGQGAYTIKATKKTVSTDGKAGMFYRTQGAQGTLTFKNVTLDGNGVSKIFLNEGGAGETVFDGVTSTNGGGIAYGSGIHISGGGSHATIKNSTLTGSTGTMILSAANYYAANDLWVGGNVYVTVENSTIGYVFVNSAPSATATNGVVHGQLTITGKNTKITYLSGEEEAADKLDKFGNNGSLVKIENGSVDTIFDMGGFAISGGTFKTELKQEWLAKGFKAVANNDGTYGVTEYSTLKEYLVNLGTSITLKIGVNEVGKNVKVTYVYNGGEEVKIEKHADGFYYIENITPQIIDRVYTVKVYEGETVVDNRELSVLGYCDTLLGTTSATEKAKTAVKALVYYGQKAKAYLGMTESADIAAVISKYNLTQDELAAPEKKVVSTGTELLISSVALNVSDKNAIVYYMTKENFEKVYGTDSKYTVTVDGVKVEKGAWSESGEYYVYKGADIYAAELGTQVEVIVNDGANDVQKLVYGAYDYCASKWNDTKVGAIAKAIYAYGVACAEYRAK